MILLIHSAWVLPGLFRNQKWRKRVTILRTLYAIMHDPLVNDYSWLYCLQLLPRLPSRSIHSRTGVSSFSRLIDFPTQGMNCQDNLSKAFPFRYFVSSQVEREIYNQNSLYFRHTFLWMSGLPSPWPPSGASSRHTSSDNTCKTQLFPSGQYSTLPLMHFNLHLSAPYFTVFNPALNPICSILYFTCTRI